MRNLINLMPALILGSALATACYFAVSFKAELEDFQNNEIQTIDAVYHQ